MNKTTIQKPQRYDATRHQKTNPQPLMERIRAEYLAAGMTEQEFDVIQRAAGNPTQAALAIAQVMARMHEDGRSKHGDTGASSST